MPKEETVINDVAKQDVQKEEKKLDGDTTDEVLGVFEPCVVSKEGGQLHRMLMERAGHPLTQSVTQLVTLI